MRQKLDDIVLVEGDNELNVEMVPIAALPFSFSSGSGSQHTCPEATAYWYPELWWTISNPSGTPATHTIKLMVLRHSHTYNEDYGPSEVEYEGYGRVDDLTIPAGGSYSYHYDGHIWVPEYGEYSCYPPHMMHYTYYYWLEDELGNKSPQVSLYRP